MICVNRAERMQKTSMIAQLVDFLYDLQAAVIDNIVKPCLPILTELHSSGDQAVASMTDSFLATSVIQSNLTKDVVERYNNQVV